MKNLHIKFAAFVAALTLSIGCSLDSNEPVCYYTAYMATTNVSGPETGTVNTPIEFMVTFPIANSCGTFAGFADLNTSPQYDIAAGVSFNGCSCQEMSTLVTEPYVFTATSPGSYTINFLREEGVAPISKTITITQ